MFRKDRYLSIFSGIYIFLLNLTFLWGDTFSCFSLFKWIVKWTKKAFLRISYNYWNKSYHCSVEMLNLSLLLKLYTLLKFMKVLNYDKIGPNSCLGMCDSSLTMITYQDNTYIWSKFSGKFQFIIQSGKQ